jgi:Protein of unknown function (DUF1592)/Protein of unknown function (DUF1588)/Protein of unknown function (DUF1585)/Protein of unknown function (DUF1587)/Protein of unknown function (DUF1595)/Planctomycete cytochrome C
MTTRFCLFATLMFALGCCALCYWGAVTSGPAEVVQAAGASTTTEVDSVTDSPPIDIVPPRPSPHFSRDVAPLLERYCVQCHDSASARGDVILDTFDDRGPDKEHTPLLLRVASVLHSGDMPPEGKPHPNPDELEIINTWLDEAILNQAKRPARVTVRRLNRGEYNNTIRDLIGLDLHPADDFPSDDVGYGFDNIGEVLSTPPILLEMHMGAADRVIREAFRSDAIGERITNPPVDTVPRAFRRIKPPVHVFRTDKIFIAPTQRVEDPELKREQRLYDILRAFADRAFRRPATHDELTRLHNIVLSAEKDGELPEAALQLALRAVLASPQFLFLQLEPERDAGSASNPDPAHDFDLASRLSYFLWSSMPDDQLIRLASLGSLRQRQNLRAQVRRMIGDQKARALAQNFGSQWLETRKLKEFAPDPALFPDFDEPLRAAMLAETELFFDSIRDKDRSVLDLLDADYTFVNERLARHYGISGVNGEWFRRVSLAGTPRGGVLTQASVLAATSNPNRTSPVKRGKWILENILGSPPSPPPSGVEALKEPKERGASETIRQQMERHRTDPACASCHRRMDPLGFGLENFNAIGGWRGSEGGKPIDSSGELPGPRVFHGPTELKAALLSRRDAFARCFAEKMLTYALGRGLDRGDRRAVDQIVARLARSDYRFSALVLAVVESEPFLNPQPQRSSQ